MSQRKLVLVDGFSIIFRAFFALPMLTTRSGQPTNAAYGFLRMLLRVIRDVEPDYLAVALDSPEPTFRHQRFEPYKANREAAPDELLSQLPIIDKLLTTMGIRQLRLPGYEADDLLGTLAKRFASDEVQALLVSGDLDVLQVVEDNIHVLMTLRGASELKCYDPAAFRERFGFPPERLPDYKGLRGDPSDNLPGIRGIGHKTAAELVQRYGTVEEILARREEVEPKRARGALAEDPETALLGKSLTTLRLDAPVDVSLEDCRLRPPEPATLREVFLEYEFTSLAKELAVDFESQVTVETLAGQVAKDQLEAATGAAPVALVFDWAAEADKRPVGLAWTTAADRAWYVSLPTAASAASPNTLPGLTEESGEDILPAVTTFLNSEIPKLLCDAKRGYWAAASLGGDLKGVAGDTLLASYLLTPERQSHPLPDVSREHLGLELPTLPTGRLKKGELPPTVAQRAQVAGTAAAALLRLEPALVEQLTERDQLSLYREVELPLARVLFEMERVGVSVDQRRLRQLADSLAAQIGQLESAIHELAGEPFNIGSTKQLQRILFEKLQLPAGKRTKTGYSTSAEVLEKLAGEHEIARRLLDYRELTKLKSTYVDGLLAAVSPKTGRIHTQFNQTGTATGRLSSSEPNLQNIPIRTEAGREIRSVFVPSGPDRMLVCADYSQVELRVLAHISGDPGLREAFASGQDIHTGTATQLFGVAPDAVTANMRRQAKVVNFGIAYGMSPVGLARDLEIGFEEAQQYILTYFATYPGVQDYMRTTIDRARQDGYVATLLGRRRYLPDLHSRNTRLREFAERTAINTPIQGTAADLMKVAMLRVQAALAETGLRAVSTIQVHDELVFDCPAEELSALCPLADRCLCEALSLEVPLVVDIEYGCNWRDLEKWTGA